MIDQVALNSLLDTILLIGIGTVVGIAVLYIYLLITFGWGP